MTIAEDDLVREIESLPPEARHRVAAALLAWLAERRPRPTAVERAELAEQRTFDETLAGLIRALPRQ